LSRTADGHWRLGVHIADVPHYVMPGSRLDEEAFNRGNSVYLVDRAIPMLPPYLTTEVCSLVPHRDRLCHTAEMILSDEGLVLRAETFSSVIHSKARLNYDQVQDFFDGKDGHGVPAEIQEVLARMRPLARALRRHRMAAGAIDLAIPEIKCVLDSDGHPLAVMKRGAKEAYQLIEEFMLSANCVVAARLRDSGGPALYRVHEPPDEEQWAAMEADLKNLGVTDLDELRRRVAELVLRFAREPLSYVLHLAVLRNFKRARYAANLVGHFGLAFPCYTHFTSPVRRYPDLAVHRLLNAIEQRRPGPYSLEDAARIAAHCSATEENADDAETESVELKRIEFYRDLLQGGQTGPFEGIVVSVVPKGLIVELGETLQRGLIPFSSMMDDYYEVVPGKGMARGRRRHAVWSLGRPVRVLITRVDTARRRVDFVLFAGDSAPPAARRKKARPK
jgi:ribonuclease R